MKTIVTIAVRVKSARLPRKALAQIAGKSLIAHLIERVKSAKKPKEVVLCTSHLSEDALLIEEAERCEIPFVAGDPDDIFQRFLAAASHQGAEHVVRVTGDNPLTDPVTIDRLIQKHLDEKNEFTMVEGLPLGVGPEVISVLALEKARRSLKDKTQSEYMIFLLSNPEQYKMGILSAEEDLRRPGYRLTVDTPEDLELMRVIYRNLYRPGEIFSLRKVIELLDANPNMLRLNNGILQKFFHVTKNTQITQKPVSNWVVDVIKENQS